MLKVFWPKRIDLNGNMIIGWRPTPNTVIAVQSISNEDELSHNTEALEILGTINYQQDKDTWEFVIDKGVLIDIKTRDFDNYLIIHFQPPNRNSLQYFSTIPLVLDLKFSESQWEGDKKEMKEKLNRQYPSIFNTKEDMEIILQKVNLVWVVTEQKSARQFAKGLFLHLMDQFINLTEPLWSIVLYYIAFGLRMVIYFLHLEIPILHFSLFQISNTAQQLNLRIEQLLFWPVQYVTWYRSEAKLSPTAQAQYIGFFNTVWLIANDIILGLAFRSFLLEYKYFLAETVQKFIQKYTCDLIEETIKWLLRWPGGLKLNAELASFLADLFQWMIFAWREAIVLLIPLLPQILFISGMFGTIGVTFVLSMLSDMVSLFTLHLQLFYIISARIYNWIVQVLDSTFHLFRGKRRNPLRNRVDSAEYDLDQLLLGTIIFTVLVFLLPTVAVFYLLFSIVLYANKANICVVVFQSGFEIILAVLNHFPLFALMLRFKDPRRLCGGIYFSIHKPENSKSLFWKPDLPPKSSDNLFHLHLHVISVNLEQTCVVQYNLISISLLVYANFNLLCNKTIIYFLSNRTTHFRNAKTTISHYAGVNCGLFL